MGSKPISPRVTGLVATAASAIPWVMLVVYAHTPRNVSGFVMDILQCSAVAVLIGLATLRDVYKKT